MSNYLHKLFSGTFSPLQEQQLVPLARVKAGKSPGSWEATGQDPQFLLKGRRPEGWTLVTWSAASNAPLRLRLYVDRGRGFNELQSVDLGLVNSECPTLYKAVVPLGSEIKGLRLDPGETPGLFLLQGLKLRSISRVGMVFLAIARFFRANIFQQQAIHRMFKEISGSGYRRGGLWLWVKEQICPKDDYQLFLQATALEHQDVQEIRANVKLLPYKPVFSVLVPVYNVKEEWLRKCIESVLNQIYPFWELCLADDKSTDPSVRRVLEEYRLRDSRIKVFYRDSNGHISAASNSALQLAAGEFIALLDNDDELTPDALYENALLLNRRGDADMIYSDEDKISEHGEMHSPYFKPDWSPDTFLSQMYTCHLGVFRTETVRRIGGFRLGFEGSQDYDLVLRFSEETNKIYHIPKVLYHWRTVPESTAGNPESKRYAYAAGERAIQEALDRRGEGGKAKALFNHPGLYRVSYPLEEEPFVSIIIPTRDKASMLQACLESIFEKTAYRKFEVIVVDNRSRETETKKLLEQWQKREPGRFKLLFLDIPFNYAALNNRAVNTAGGELVVLLNNDVEVISSDWLRQMAGQARRKSVGAVGALLLYPNGTVQHAGVILGLRGTAGHSHRGFWADQPGYFGRLLAGSNCAAVTGACLMVKKEAYQSVGGMDEEFPVDFNDVDFCLKLLAKGYYNLVLPQIRLYHYESQTRGAATEDEDLFRAAELLKSRWGQLLADDPFYSPNLTLELDNFSPAVPPRKRGQPDNRLDILEKREEI